MKLCINKCKYCHIDCRTGKAILKESDFWIISCSNCNRSTSLCSNEIHAIKKWNEMNPVKNNKNE